MVAGHGKAGQKIASVLPSFHGVLTGDVVLADARGHRAELPRRPSAGCRTAPARPSCASCARKRRGGVRSCRPTFGSRTSSVYREWYGEHGAPELNDQARLRTAASSSARPSRKADLVAVPGCYPTATALALAPLVKAGIIDLDSIIVDAKSGASGAGRGLGESVHFSQLAEGFRAYKVGGLHRHTPEIEQTLSTLAGAPAAHHLHAAPRADDPRHPRDRATPS